MADITELYKQRQALDEQIQNAINEAKEGGEVITVDGRDFSSFLDFEGKLQSGKLSDLVPLYRKDADGDIDLNYTGELSIEEIVELFGAEAATLLQQAIEAGETSVEDISNAKTDALAAIGESDSSGARGNAISSINAAKTAALGAIGESNTEGARGSAISAIDSHVETVTKPAINQYVDNTSKPSIDQYVNDTSKPSIDSYVNSTSKPALDTYTAEKKAELDSYVTSTSKPALDAYTTEKKGEIDSETTSKLDAALSAIGQTDEEGARKDALDAISASLASAKSEISTAQTNGVNAVDTAKNSAISAIDQKVSSANATIDGKVSAASASANAASESASAAAGSASDAAGSASAAKTSETNAKTSESNAAASASAASGAASGASASAGQAADSASAASNSAGAAASSATQAAGSASAASSSATAAQTSASQAAGSATEAESAAALAKKWASNPVDQPVEGSGESAEYSAEHWAKKAEEAANSPAANETTLGRVRITTNPDYARPAGVTDPVSASIESLQSVRTAVNTALSKIKVMTSEQLNAAINKAITEYQAQVQAQGIDLTDTAFLNGGGVTILVSWILTFVAQETGDKVTQAAMDAAIQEAVKDIPYPVDEDVSFSHDFGYYEGSSLVGSETITREYTIESGIIAFGKAKRITISLSLSGKERSGAMYGTDTYVGQLKLPEGGTYIKLKSDGGFAFYEGGATILSISVTSKESGVEDGKETSATMYLARLS